MALWVLSLGLIFVNALITWDQNREGGEPWTESGDIAFNTLSPSAWALGVAIMIVLCEKNHGGIWFNIISIIYI